MIKIKKKEARKIEPYYLLKFDYMIGDADGSTTEEMTFGVGVYDDKIERFVKLINGLKPYKGTWGIVFDSYEFHKFKDQLSEDDFKFLKDVMFNDGLFDDAIRGETDYSFLVFEGVTLYYYDETGVRYDTEFV